MRPLLRSGNFSLAFLGIFGFVPALRAQSTARPPVSLRVPDSIGVFAMDFRKDFDDPSEGVMLRYKRAGSVRVDVFVYPGPDLEKNCPTDCALKVMDGEVDSFISAFPEMLKRRYTDTISVAVRRTLTPTPGEPWQMGRYLRLREVTKGVIENSDYFLFYVPGVRVKLRATYPVDSAIALGVSAFSRQLIPALLAPPVVAKDEGDSDKHIAVTLTLAGSQSTIFAQMVGALLKKGYTIADSSRVTGRIVTAPFMGWPAGSEKDPWHGTTSPGIVIGIELKAKGDSTDVQIAGRSPTVVGWTDPEVATQLELISVVALAGDFPTPKRR